MKSVHYPGPFLLFIFLFIIAAICSFWMTNLDKKVREKGICNYSIMDLEKPQNAESLKITFQLIEEKQATDLVHTNLMVDFVFMPAVYAGIALWLFAVSKKITGGIKKVGLFLAMLQIFPWAFDISENILLLKALHDPLHKLNMQIGLFKLMVDSKFMIAIAGALLALLTSIFIVFTEKDSPESLNVKGEVL